MKIWMVYKSPLMLMDGSAFLTHELFTSNLVSMVLTLHDTLWQLIRVVTDNVN